MKISIRRSPCGKGHYCVYKGESLIATMSNEKPTRANGRTAPWGIAWLSGRFEWFDSQAEARDCALKG